MMKITITEKICQALEPTGIFCQYGYPFSLKTDNGPQFVSESFERYLEYRGIEHRKSTPLWPQANGEAEQQNRMILKALKVAAVGKCDLKEELDKFLLTYRCTPQSCTKATPALQMFGREIHTKLPEMHPERRDLMRSWFLTRIGHRSNWVKEYSDGRCNAAPRDITGIGVKDFPSAWDNWKYLSDNWTSHPTCPTGQVNFEPPFMPKAVVGTENTANEYQTRKMWAPTFSVRTSKNYPHLSDRTNLKIS